MIIYFIQAIDTNGPIKIGSTNNIQRRLPQLRMASPVPLTLLKFIEGDETTETKIHLYFSHLRLHGEWFRATDELLDFISSPRELPEVQYPVESSLKYSTTMIKTITDQSAWSDKVYTTRQAIIYLKSQFPKGEQRPFFYKELDYHRTAGDITPEPVKSGAENRSIYFYRQSELDRFLATYKPPETHPIVDLSAILHRLGKEYDTVLAKEVINPHTGKPISSQTIGRERKRLGIPAKVTPVTCDRCGHSWKTPRMHEAFCPKCNRYNKLNKEVLCDQ